MHKLTASAAAACRRMAALDCVRCLKVSRESGTKPSHHAVKGATCALCCDNRIVLLSLQRVISVALTDGELNELVTHHALDKAHQLAELAAGIPHRMHAGEFGLQHLLSLTDQPERANKVSVRQKPTDALLRCHTNSDCLAQR